MSILCLATIRMTKNDAARIRAASFLFLIWEVRRFAKEMPADNLSPSGTSGAQTGIPIPGDVCRPALHAQFALVVGGRDGGKQLHRGGRARLAEDDLAAFANDEDGARDAVAFGAQGVVGVGRF